MDYSDTPGVVPAEPALKPVSQKAFFYFIFLAGMQGLLGKLVGFFIPLYFDTLGFSGVQTGLYFTFASIATIILSLPMGISTDKKPIAHIFMLSFLLSGVFHILMCFGNVYQSFTFRCFH